MQSRLAITLLVYLTLCSSVTEATGQGVKKIGNYQKVKLIDQLQLFRPQLGSWMGRSLAEGAKLLVKMDVDSILNGHFIRMIMKMRILNPESKKVHEPMELFIIGWDPDSKKVKSWLFSSHGNHDEGVITQQDEGMLWQGNHGKQLSKCELSTDANTLTESLTRFGPLVPKTRTISFKRLPKIDWNEKGTGKSKRNPFADQHLKRFKPFKGNWIAKFDTLKGITATDHFKFEWMLNENFLAGYSRITSVGKLLTERIVVMGFNPNDQSILLWSFRNDETFVKARIHRGEHFKTKIEGKDRTGKHYSAVHSHRFPNPDTWIFSKTERRKDGRMEPDVRLRYTRLKSSN